MVLDKIRDDESLPGEELSDPSPWGNQWVIAQAIELLKRKADRDEEAELAKLGGPKMDWAAPERAR